MALQFGLTTFGDVTVGVDGRLSSHADVIRQVIEEAVLAEEVGIDFFGIGEHHRADFAVSAPEILLAVIAGRTKKIRLCSATTILSSDDPIRVFQRFATLDAASMGRAEVILGRGWFTESFSLFGYEMADYNSLFEEKLTAFVELACRNRVSFAAGKRAPLVDREVYPVLERRPLKTWIAVGSTPDSVLRAVQHNLPMMIAVIGGNPERFTPLVELYRLGFERLRRPALEIGIHSTGYVAATDSEARSDFWTYYKIMRDRIGAERSWPPIQEANFEAEISKGSLYVGCAETVARRIGATMKALSATRFDLKYSVGMLPHEKLMRSIELYGKKVIPLVRDMLGN